MQVTSTRVSKNMSSVSWLCLLTLVCLIGESIYIVCAGRVAAGPFRYRKHEQPVAFYTTVFGLFAGGAVATAYIWPTYG